MSNLMQAHDIDSVPRTEDIKISEEAEFASMFFDDKILYGLKACGFKKPSPIQLKALPLVRCGVDLIVQSKSGTGKTLVFTLAILECVDLNLDTLQAIVLTPTREIALQVSDVISSVGSCIEGLEVCTFIGGRPVQRDQELAKKCKIAVGAPGRMKHLVELGSLSLDMLSCFVLDEADQLMEDSFREDIKFMFACKPDDAQVIATSATFTPIMIDFLGQFMRRPRHVTPEGDTSSVLLGIKQFSYFISPFLIDPLAQLFCKQKALMKILNSVSFDQCIVFVNFHSKAQSVCNFLLKQNHSTVWLAGSLDQDERIKALKKLKSRECRVLVTTDLAARGIDVPWVNLVINMDIPYDYRTYLHRMGRAGRYGSHGLLMSLVSCEDELSSIKRIIRRIQNGNSLLPVRIIPKSLNCDVWASDDSCFEVFHVEEESGSCESDTGPDSSSETCEVETTSLTVSSKKQTVQTTSLTVSSKKQTVQTLEQTAQEVRRHTNHVESRENKNQNSIRFTQHWNSSISSLRHQKMNSWYDLWKRQCEMIYKYSHQYSH